ncbi:MAG: ParB N-terminal domain-containing protein [Ignavibacteriaceae bacterium]|jgi:hypothetical protein|nr:ParB N-terminal domain-containing protein [Ignavibacteriaceae bacterium]
MKKDVFTKDYITISGKEIEVESGFINHEKLKYYADNPRIYSIIYAGEKSLSQNEIEERLSDKEHVRLLIQSIKANGGLTDPIIVRGGDFVVLEGNSRLAAYRTLSKKDPIQWGKIKCKILPHDISNDLVFTLLGEYHIIGRKDWQPYEQAGYLYRRHKLQKVSLEKIQHELGLKKSEMEHLVEVYEFMFTHNDTDINHWSYYEEYLKSRDISRARETHSDFDHSIVCKIKVGEITKAIDIRDKLVPISKSTPKIIKGFISGKIKFEDAYERAYAGGAGNAVFEKLHRFREWLANSSIEEDIIDNGDQLVKKCIFELGKISKRSDDILNKINKT